MKVLYGLEAVTTPFTHSVLTVGNFDGVHLAHQRLLAQARTYASGTGGPVVVLTFEPHPLTVVAPGKAPLRLSHPDEKLRRLADAGADVTVVARSDPDLLGIEAEQFVEKVIVEKFRPTHIVEGPSFGFGRGRKGTPELLRDIASRFGCKVHIVEPVKIEIADETVMVSSSLVRRLLTEAKVDSAALCLGRPYALIGEVVHGDGRGRTIGFPTANVDVIDQLGPREGVYAGRATVGDIERPCAVSIGHTPTFGGTSQRVEAYLLDLEDADLYGRTMRVEFDRLIREQHVFGSSEALVEQVHRDVEAVRSGAERSEQGIGTQRESAE